MAAEYLANAVQEVSLNSPAIFTASIPCTRGYVYHEDETGVFILRGITCQCFATYQITFNGNVAIPETATAVTPIAMAITINGEPRPTSTAVYTPAAVGDYGNITCTAIVRVPKGCCFSLAVESVPATTDPVMTPTAVIELRNANLVVSRIA